jgi:hypothetical protein
MSLSKLFQVVISFFLIISLTLSSANADSRFDGDISQILAQFRENSRIKSYTEIAPLALKEQTAKGETRKFVFTAKKTKTWNSYQSSGKDIKVDDAEMLFLKGVVSGAGIDGVSPVAGSVFETDGTAELHLIFQAKDSAGKDSSIEAVVALEPRVGKALGAAAVTAKTGSDMKGKKCGNDSEGLSFAVAESNSKRSSLKKSPAKKNKAAANKIIQLATDADYEFYQVYGASSNAQIASMVNAAEIVYEDQLGLTFDITNQHLESTSSQVYTYVDPSDLLDQFANYENTNNRLGSADLYHLFSGKSTADGVLGVAWVGVTCAASTYSYGLSKQYNAAVDYIVFAHEVGHNMGAEHDTALPRSIMYPSVGTDQTSFSSTTISQISDHVDTYGSCLATQSDDPTADPRSDDPTLTLKASFSKTSGKLSARFTLDNALDDSCQFQLLMSDRSNMKSPSRVKVTDNASSLRLIGETSSRSSSKVYLQGVYSNCAANSGVSTTSGIISFTPKGSSSKSVSARKFIQSIVKKLEAK